MTETDRRRAHLFTGQGSQHEGMWADLSESRGAGEIFTTANEVVGFDLLELCSKGPLDELTKTSNAQPAILVHGLAALAAARELHPELLETKPEYSLGHSLGEYGALVDADVIGIRTAIYLVRQRGLLMEELGPEGRMAALVGYKDQGEVTEICRETGTEAANFNGPAQTSISGGAKEIKDAIKLANEREIRAIPLTVTRPFHSSLMLPAQKEFKKVLAPLEFKDPQIPVILNVTGRPSLSGEEIKRFLVDQITQPVRWYESVQWVLDQGINTFLEFGPKPVLKGLLRGINQGAVGICIDNYEAAQKLMLK